jgi:membrane-associated phospholipid phosphatase
VPVRQIFFRQQEFMELTSTTASRLNIARWISVIGHPFLLMPLLTGLIAYRLLPPHQAILAEVVALGVVIIPAAVYTFVKVRNGTWNNLDVSDRQHRGQFYRMLSYLLGLLTIIAWFADVPRSIAIGTSMVFALISIAFVLIKAIKVSLHTGFSVFVACVLFLIQPLFALLAFMLAIAVGWSRVVLERHTTREVMLGGVLGLAIGGVFIYALHLQG